VLEEVWRCFQAALGKGEREEREFSLFLYTFYVNFLLKPARVNFFIIKIINIKKSLNKKSKEKKGKKLNLHCSETLYFN